MNCDGALVLSSMLDGLTVNIVDLMQAIRDKIATGEYEFSQHALNRSIRRVISVQEIREAIDSGEIIEDYPNDKYGPSCLILGFSASGQPIHVQCSHATRSLVKIITLYEPNPALWIDHRIRKS